MMIGHCTVKHTKRQKNGHLQVIIMIYPTISTDAPNGLRECLQARSQTQGQLLEDRCLVNA